MRWGSGRHLPGSDQVWIRIPARKRDTILFAPAEVRLLCSKASLRGTVSNTVKVTMSPTGHHVRAACLGGREPGWKSRALIAVPIV